MAKYNTILFDFDGTLADSSNCSVVATQQAFEQFALPKPTAQEIIHFMGLPIEISFRKMGAAPFTEQQFAMLLDAFRQHYRELSDTLISAFPFALECVKQLKEAGKTTAIITSKKTDVARLNAQTLGLLPYIDVVIGSDLVKEYKPHPEGIFTALHALGVTVAQLSNVIMIGDAVSDIKMGQAANIDTCAVTWGAHSEQALKQASPNYLVHHFEQLTQLCL
ncbi:TPA: HAD-IA family hydrolase [Pasteurella multocida]|nr:HAD-IA family hydrolase [Pasteurella multocida]HDR1921785.1 HAD-IA family hydrolase [Pasteurella multocida]HDR1928460.1 HAD-IA family hydrolase [Pasteurella multocida]HED4462916.1 HAD-IA family hydrolase [Pasteurella multocida]HED4473725.1 HAD-IA family hydrolase [Pasteurella multocida]